MGEQIHMIMRLSGDGSVYATSPQAPGLIYGPGPFQDHHGSALWLQDSQGWFMVRNLAGIEWSAQFCAEPAKVDLLRQNAKRLYDLVAPQLKQELDPNGLLDTPITDAVGVSKWTDSIFNAGVPLQQNFHIGVMPMGKAQAQNPPATADAQNSPDASDQAQATAAPGDPESAGVHHYPTPIVDIQLFKYDDFQLWVTDSEGNPAAVTPVGARGSGVASVHVQYATPGSQLAQQKNQQENAKEQERSEPLTRKFHFSPREWEYRNSDFSANRTKGLVPIFVFRSG